ncbi:unnamed protein product [Arctia plantaginis]|uniref:Uncharacterized protein n=1 Tax=Arctia plantaginis TaxID=874455 RepID=A0A8S1BB35_ARCPL|nr:unnamed protein product [Arctia plantaginis]
MLPILRTIRLLVAIQIITTIRGEDGFGEQNVHLQHFASNNENTNGLSFNTNLFEKDPNAQSVSVNNVQYQQNDYTNGNNDFNQRSPYARSKKVYRIKNPFQTQKEDSERQQENTSSQDSGTGASNQYASVQYSLPPEEFLKQLRAESQYYQQSQVSTPASNLGYTATPAPQQQYQYSTIQYSTVSQPTYENSNQQGNNQMPLEPKSSYGSTYDSSPSLYQYSTTSTFLDNTQSTPSPGFSHLSTPLNNGQYSSQSSTYVSSASPVYVSSPSNQQSFFSSPLSMIQTGSPDYGNRVTSTISNNHGNYENNDYSAGRYPINIQQQYQNDYSTTTTPNPSSYSEHIRDMWQNNVNSGNNGASVHLQNNMYNQYQKNQFQSKQEDMRADTYAENTNTHRIGSMTSANNMFVNYVQPDNQALNNLKLRTRNSDHEISQTGLYSNGDFGWKLTGKKPLTDTHSSSNYYRYSPSNTETSDNTAISQMNFHMGTGKPYSQISKSTSDTIDQEFAQAAANAHERFKQQQQLQQQQQQQYSNINTSGMSNHGGGDPNLQGISYYRNDDKNNKFTDLNSNYYSQGYSQNDVVTASPFYLSVPRDNIDNKAKEPFDHDKALKNIVPIGVSNVVSSAESKPGTSSENNNRLFSLNYAKDQPDQNIRQYIRPVTDSFYKDQNAFYGFNVKTKSDDYSPADNFKNAEQDGYGKQSQSQEPSYNQGYSSSTQGLSYLTQPSNTYQDNLQSSSTQQFGLHRNHNQLPTDIASILKLNDMPHKLTQGLSSDALKFHNINFEHGGIPSPLPMRINQNVGSHQLDVTTNLLNKLLLNKQPTININQPGIHSQASGSMSTINGFKVVNPYNVDLKLVSELLKGKPAADDTHMLSVRDQYTNPSPLNLDYNSQLQLLLKNDNNRNLVNDGLSALGSSFIDTYSNSRYPYQKYSRSQEEEESIVPIAAASNTHPIGAVMEPEDSASEREVNTAGDYTAQSDVFQDNFEEIRPKTRFIPGSRIVGERNRHPNILISGRHSYQKTHFKSDVSEPHPLLKPPSPHHSPRGSHMILENKHNRRRRVHKPKLLRVIKTEPLFEAGALPENLDNSVPILLRPPAPVAEAKSDFVDSDQTL